VKIRGFCRHNYSRACRITISMCRRSNQRRFGPPPSRRPRDRLSSFSFATSSLFFASTIACASADLFAGFAATLSASLSAALSRKGGKVFDAKRIKIDLCRWRPSALIFANGKVREPQEAVTLIHNHNSAKPYPNWCPNPGHHGQETRLKRESDDRRRRPPRTRARGNSFARGQFQSNAGEVRTRARRTFLHDACKRATSKTSTARLSALMRSSESPQ
jgi:hypothetical protein